MQAHILTFSLLPVLIWQPLTQSHCFKEAKTEQKPLPKVWQAPSKLKAMSCLVPWTFFFFNNFNFKNNILLCILHPPSSNVNILHDICICPAQGTTHPTLPFSIKNHVLFYQCPAFVR